MILKRFIALLIVASLASSSAIGSMVKNHGKKHPVAVAHNLIRPGIGIGQISLGMALKGTAVARHLTPTHVKHLPGGILVESWLGKAPTPPHIISEKNLLSNYLTLFFQRGKVVQIEASAESFYTDKGLTTANPATDFRKAYPQYSSASFQRNIVDDVTYSLPAAKHFVAYENNKAQGIAWKYGCWGDMAPDPDPTEPIEAVIVHIKGRPVIYDPFDALPYSGTWPLSK